MVDVKSAESKLTNSLFFFQVIDQQSTVRVVAIMSLSCTCVSCLDIDMWWAYIFNLAEISFSLLIRQRFREHKVEHSAQLSKEVIKLWGL